jgi:hypothetical protein
MMSLRDRHTEGPAWQRGFLFVAYYSADTLSGRRIVQAIRRVFLASLFFMLTVLLAIWFYPAISAQFSNFNSSVQGGVGSGTSAYFYALDALDIASALLCVSALFYGILLAARRRRPPK